MLGRKDKADSTRNALNVLQRFKFLFNLPLNIERNIQKVASPTHTLSLTLLPTQLHYRWVSKIFFFNEMNTFIQQGRSQLIKSDNKSFIMFQIIYISHNCCSFQLFFNK